MKNIQILPSKEDKEIFIKNNFDEIAKNYDKFNDLFTFGMHRAWKKTLINMLHVEDAKNAIDLCCGSGDLAILMGNPNLNKDLQIVACDFSEGMLAVMEKRIRKSNIWNRIEIRKENVLSLPSWYNNKFDIATVGYGVRNVKDRIQFFKEVYRILNDKGRFGILEVGTIEPKWIRPFAHFFMKHIIPLIGYILQGKKHKMYDYLPASALEFPPPETIINELESVGFKNIHYKRLFFGASIIYIAYK
ncbi:MAG: demethylmenaquinone methyltransferase [Leptospiraceae bacterium]|nr:MAG: demethylmenaquinone methyltransferase [Leptospiraceae bacterium]